MFPRSVSKPDSSMNMYAMVSDYHETLQRER